MLKIRLKEAQAELSNATDQKEIDRLNTSIARLKQAIWEVEMIEFEERVGFKSMERNAGVWDER
jgi:predicted  nucleic acid-binding Zn-ribbon protein